MASLYDSASLVMIPSGYKEDKIYSIKPTDGSGDLTFSRSNDTATRVNSDGLIEKVRTNLALQSEAFNTTWSAASLSITANTTANPLNGALTADTITLTGATAAKYITQAIICNGSTTTSVYLKAGTHQFVQICLGTDATPFANFDLVNGTASATGSTASIVSLGGGWYRCSMSFTSTTGNSLAIVAVDSLAATRFASTSSTGTFIAFGCQVETGDIATDYIATTTAAVSVGPVANLPRLDYLDSSCPKLLLEPQRTNLVTFSEQLDNAAWSKTSAGTGSVPVVTANDAISPDGYMNADKVVFNGGAGTTTGDQSFVFNLISLTAGQVVAFTAYFKGAVGGEKITLRGTEITLTTSWQRYTSIFTAPTTGTYSHYFGVLRDTNGQALTSNATIYAWGCQAEIGAYETSYIPTLSAASTRGVDAASKTGISSLIGQTEGTLFAEFTPTSDLNADVIQLLANTGTDNAVTIGCGGGNIYGVVYTNPNYRFNTAIAQTIPNNTFKVAICYKTNDFTFFINGVKVASGANSYSPSSPLTRISFNQAFLFGNQVIDYKSVLVFPVKLTDAEAIALTTL